MAEPLCSLSGGDVKDAPLAAILVEALRARATGELRIDASGGTSRVYFRSGQPCGAQIFFGFKPLGQFLLELGWIDIDALDRSLAAVASGEKQGEALVNLGAITAERLKLGLSLHHQRHLKTLAGLAEGHYGFLPADKLPTWTDEIQISAHRAILDALAMPPGQPVCDRILSRIPAGKGLRLREGWPNFITHFQLDPYEDRLVQRLARPKELVDLLNLGSVPPEKANALAAALYLMGVAIPATAEALTPGPPGHEPAREESAPPGKVGSPGPTSDERKRRMMEAQQRELEEMERQRRQVEDDERRRRQEEEEEHRIAREEALRKPAPEFRSDAASAKERRTRLLQRAIGNIPGAEAFRRAATASGPTVAPGATPARDPSGNRSPGPGRDSAGPRGTNASPGPRVEVVQTSVKPDDGRPPTLGEDPTRFKKHVHEKHGTVAREDYFARLGLAWTASRDQIKQAFFNAAKLYHPDKLPPELAELGPKLKDIFSAVNEAYQVLQDDERRRGYLQDLRKGSRANAAGGSDDEVKGYVAQAEVALRKRDFVKAEKAFRAGAKASGRADLLAQAAWALYSDSSRGLGEKARTELQQITHDSPSCAPAHYFLGVIAKLGGDIDRAEQCFREAVRVNPKHLEANQELRLIDMRRAGKR